MQDLCEFQERPTRPKFTPDGKRIAFLKGLKGLYVLDLATGEDAPIHSDWSQPDFDWSPDGKWFVAAKLDTDFNRDIWLFPAQAKSQPFNLSRHPYSEHDPVWSPDGKMIAYAGRRASGEPGAHLCLVWLEADDERTARDRKLEKALDKMKGRTPASKEETKSPSKKATGVTIDFDRLHERVKRINLGEGAADTLFWSPDSKKIAFTGSYDGKKGTFTIDIGDAMTPKLLTTTAGVHPRWLKQGNQIVWLVNGVPTSTPGVASITPAAELAPTPISKKGFGKNPAAGVAPPSAAGGGLTFAARQQVDLPARNAAIFDTCWRVMRDQWYDRNLGNNDWQKIRAKYRPLAEQAPDGETVTTLVQMMLGELNGSHLGFTMNPAGAAKATEPRDATGHLGVRFDPSYTGPGLKVRDVLPGGPADKKRSRLEKGDIIQAIDGSPVSPAADLTLVLNGPADREVALSVLGLDGKAARRDG